MEEQLRQQQNIEVLQPVYLRRCGRSNRGPQDYEEFTSRIGIIYSLFCGIKTFVPPRATSQGKTGRTIITGVELDHVEREEF